MNRGLLVGLAIIAISSPSTAFSRTSVCQQVKADLQTIRLGTMIYRVDHDRLPPSLRDLVVGGVLEPSQRLSDPWGSPYFIVQNGDELDVATLGPDRVRGTADDFSSAASSPCPRLPDPMSHGKLLLALLLAAATSLVGLAICFAARKPHLPPTALN